MLAFGFALLSVSAPSVSASTAAQAAEPAVPAPGSAFDPLYPQMFIGQDFPTTTLLGGQQSAGVLALNSLGSTAGISYNAIGFNVNDGFIYGIRAGANETQNGTNHLVRVGSGGVAVDLGVISGLPLPVPINNRVSTYTQGTFGGISGAAGNSNLLYVREGSSAKSPERLWVVDVLAQTATKVEFLAGSAAMGNIADFTWVGGKQYLGSRGSLIGASPTHFYQIVEIEGLGFVVDSYPNPITSMVGANRQFGAAWTLGNGLLGFSDNRTGEVFLVELSYGDRGLAFTLVAQFDGPATQNNDGTSAPGGEVDLGIVKTGPANYVVGETLDYTMTVTNYGPSVSSGSILTDTPPEGLGNVTTTTPGCTVRGGIHLTCVLGALEVGAQTQVAMSATVLTAITHSGGRVFNRADIRGNEYDPNSGNDWSVTAADPYPGVLERAKSSMPVSGTHVTAGELVNYVLTFHNSGAIPVKVDQVDVLADVLDDADLEGAVVALAPLVVDASSSDLVITGTLPAGATATVSYSMRVKSPLPSTASGKLGNFLVTKGEVPPSTCDLSTHLCTEHPVVGSLSWNKVNDQTPALHLAGSEWTLTPYDRASTPALVPAGSTTVIDCVALVEADCTAADKDPAEGKFAVTDLAIGSYQLAETRAPAGYLQINPLDIAVYANVAYGDIVNTQVEVPALPLTGGVGHTLFWVLTGGFGTLAIAAFILQRRRIRL